MGGRCHRASSSASSGGGDSTARNESFRARRPRRLRIGFIGQAVGFLYHVAELASARHNALAAKLLIVDDGGYGILREYQRDSYGNPHAVDLVQPDFAALGAAFDVPVRITAPERLEDDLAWALGVDGPVVVLLRALLDTWAPTG